jgi:hypothetical protein
MQALRSSAAGPRCGARRMGATTRSPVLCHRRPSNLRRPTRSSPGIVGCRAFSSASTTLDGTARLAGCRLPRRLERPGGGRHGSSRPGPKPAPVHRPDAMTKRAASGRPTARAPTRARPSTSPPAAGPRSRTSGARGTAVRRRRGLMAAPAEGVAEHAAGRSNEPAGVGAVVAEIQPEHPPRPVVAGLQVRGAGCEGV